MNPLISTTIAITIVLINGLIGHFFAPKGIFLTPVVLTLTTWLLIVKTERLSLLWKSLLSFGYVAFNDILLKLFAGGRHDNEGYGWIFLFMFIGLILSYSIMLMNVIKAQGESKAHKIISLIVFPLLVVVHLYLFSNLGIGRSYWYSWTN